MTLETGRAARQDPSVRLFHEHETHHAALDDLRGVLAIDLGYLADEVTRLADSAALDQPAYDAGVAAYERARDGLDALDEPSAVPAICRQVFAGRRSMARIQARLDGVTPPDGPQPCFFDPGHGIGVQLVAWTPDGGLEARTVPVCAADFATIEAGEQPAPRVVAVGDGEAMPFWSAPRLFAYWFQGYFGSGDGCIPVQMLEGFPLDCRFAPPGPDPSVIEAEQVFRRAPTAR